MMIDSPRACLARHSDKPRAHLPFQFFYEREILDSQQSQNSGHPRKLMVES